MKCKQRASCRVCGIVWVVVTLIFAVSVAPSAWSGPVRLNEPIQPLQQIDDLDPARIALGDKLFHDRRLSADDTVSCSSCHDLPVNGSDSRPNAKGIGGAMGSIKVPTVWNSGFNFVQFWDGRVVTLEEQVPQPIHNPIEMGSSWAQVVTKLQKDPAIVAAFDASYPEGITPKNVQDAIATFERSLVTLNSPFDRWLLGDDSALSAEALKGYRLFKSYGCISCHQGQNVGGNMFATMGAMARGYFTERGGEITKSDLGRYNVTGEAADRHMFKVPSLRLAVRQSHFFHDGSSASLSDAIQTMAHHQLGRNISSSDVYTIAAFLESLVGEHTRLDP